MDHLNYVVLNLKNLAVYYEERDMTQDEDQYPLITVGVVVLNREWIIGKMLNSLIRQTYPHNRIFVIIVDGKSKDRTVEIAQKILEKSDFMGYNIIVRESNIPEGRNICIENMRGDMLLFWDSDVIMEPNAIQELVKTMIQEKADIVTADGVSIYVNTTEEIDEKINEAKKMRTYTSENYVVEVPFVGMGHTIVSKNVLDSLRFDPDLTFGEDLDFSVRAREKNFKIKMNKHVLAFDINMKKMKQSDIYIDMPLRKALKGLRKKAKAHVLSGISKPTPIEALKFFLENKRFLFYLGYILMGSLTIFGILFKNIFILSFPIYLVLYAVYQVKRRDFIRGGKAVLKSIVVGIPLSLLMVYYFLTLTRKK